MTDQILGRVEFGPAQRLADAESDVLRLHSEKMEHVERCIAQAAEIDRLRAALQEAVEWNWLDKDNPPPDWVVATVDEALGRGPQTDRGESE